MKAVQFTRYGPPDVLRPTEVPTPEPRSGEVLVRVRATSVSFGDLIHRRFNDVTPAAFSMPLLFWALARLHFGLARPRHTVPGAEFAGEIAQTGADVDGFAVGDKVFGYLGPAFGAYAEYVRMKASGIIAPMPASMSFEEAATVPYGAVTALNLMRAVERPQGKRVLVIGASGAIGSHIVQLAKHHGAEVTGVCHTLRVPFVLALGADHAIDYTAEDFTQHREAYDLIVDILGKSTFAKCKESLGENGTYLRASFKTGELLQMLWTRLAGGKRVVCALSAEKSTDLLEIKRLADAGVIRSMVDRSFPLQRAADAHRYMEDGFRKGRVAITVGDDDAKD